jgi:hypothetical protein
MRSSDADADQVIIADKAAIDSANTAAEVADAAMALDIEPPTPPISDAEAGRIGLRRLSQTPIADVTAVSSEVSDSAALLDTDELGVRFLTADQNLCFFADAGVASNRNAASIRL